MLNKKSASKVFGKSVPAPVGGLNARDALANMPETDAVTLDNWFPTPSDVEVRGGSVIFAQIPAGFEVESLLAYNGPAQKKFFCIAKDPPNSQHSIWEITNGSQVEDVVISASTNSRYQYTNYSTPGGHYIYAVNGETSPQLYDGSAWTAITDISAPAITGVTASNLIHVNIYKNRLWFTEANSTKVWYLPVNSIGGAAVSIDFGPLLRLGGYLMGMTTWTLNTQNGTDEVAVFVSSEGEVIVYQGYDPSSASTWSQAGHFRLGRPIGRRFFCKAGADVIMLTADGVIPLSQAMLTDRSQLRIALSDKIVNLISNDIVSYASNFGWQVILFPIGNKLIVNVPKVENSVQYQYVMNTITKAWCSFGKVNTNSAWGASCFEIFNDAIYYGDNGVVVQADIGTTDNDDDIMAYAKPAFSYFGQRGRQKYFTMARPILQMNGTIQVAAAMNVDFEDKIPNVNYSTVLSSTTSPWDTSPWDTSPWGGDNTIIKNWQTTNGIGFSGSLSIAAKSNNGLSWQSTDYVFQLGGIL